MTLARRLTFLAASLLRTELGWRMCVVLSWQRLVRAGKVRDMRRASPMWVAAERCRVHGLSERYQSQVAASGVWRTDNKRLRGCTYSWREQEEAVRQLSVTSGAAAVIARRRVDSASGDKRARSPSPPGAPDATGSPAHIAFACPRGDAALFLPLSASYRAPRRARVDPRIPRPPFGDG